MIYIYSKCHNYFFINQLCYRINWNIEMHVHHCNHMHDIANHLHYTSHAWFRYSDYMSSPHLHCKLHIRIGHGCLQYKVQLFTSFHAPLKIDKNWCQLMCMGCTPLIFRHLFLWSLLNFITLYSNHKFPICVMSPI